MLTDFDVHLYLHGPLNNYGMLLHHRESGKTACIDCGNAAETRKALTDTGWELNEIWVTHHHPDHTDGIAEIKAETDCFVRGPEQGRSKPIGNLDVEHWDGDVFDFAGHSISVIATPGHTLDMINFHLADQSAVFTGDTLFTLGCGRLFEGEPALVKQSLEKLAALSPETLVFGAHEYTAANIAFAKQVDPSNNALMERIAKLEALLDAGKATVPVKLAGELQTNPFLRCGDPEIRRALSMVEASDVDVFAKLREIRNGF
ncbi:MAG: hydroxyacylglutathione hydrolase [Pseudomonadota bacterium]